MLDTKAFLLLRNQRNAVDARWFSSPSGKGHHCISECKRRKCCRSPPPPKSPDLHIIGKKWDELNRRVSRTGAILYSDHTESTESKNYLQVEQPPSELRSALCDVNGTPLSCRSEQWGGGGGGGGGGGTYPLLSLHGHGRRCRIWLRNIVIFTLFYDIFDQVWSLLKYWKNMNFYFTIDLNYAFAFFNFSFYSK